VDEGDDVTEDENEHAHDSLGGAADTASEANEPRDGAVPVAPTSPPTDLAALIDHLARLTVELEQTWSNALDQAAVQEALRQHDRCWTALNLGIRSSASNQSEVAAAAGLDDTIRGFPLKVEDISTLHIDANGSLRWRQLVVAQLYAVAQVGNAHRDLHRPTAISISLPSGDESNWWESGAFSLLLATAKHLARVTDHMLLARDEALGGEARNVTGGETSLRLALENVRLAHTALNIGLAEAAGLYALLSLRHYLAGVAAVPESSLPATSVVTGQVEELQAMAPFVELLEQTCERLSSGKHVDLGITVPLAHFAVDQVTRLFALPISHASREQLERIADASGEH